MARLCGTPRDDRLAGIAADTVLARGGDDRVSGGGGDDALFGEAGDDELRGDAGSDLIGGAPGADAAFFGGATAPVAVDPARGRADSGGDVDRLVGIESVNAGRFGDVRLSGLDQSGFGRAGDDFLVGGAGADDLSYFDDNFDEAGPGTRGAAADLAAGRATDDWGDIDAFSGFEGLFGSGLADLLGGDGRGNFLFGEAGTDVLEGRGGADILDGGAGGDRRFVYAAAGDSGPGGADRVADFEPPGRGGRGGDQIDVAAIDADITRAKNQAFAFGGGPAAAPSELRAAAAPGGGTLVEASTDRDADPELVIRLADVDAAALIDADFVL